MIVDRYYYSQLNKSEQVIYKAFYKGVMERKEIIPIPVKGKISQEMFNRVFTAMTRDNPLVYFLNQSACSLAQDAFGHNAICPQYFLSKEKIHTFNKKIEETVNDLAISLKLTEGSDYEKEIKIHDWLCQRVSYDYDGADLNDPVRFMEAHNIIGVFAHNKAQCEGIAKAVKVLLNAVDIKCIVATGIADGNGQKGPHAWNIVKIDDKAYQLDVTWDIGACGKNKDRVAYDYFNITDEMMNTDHMSDSKLPVCDSMDMNYFRKNKLVFKSKVKLLSYVESALKNGATELYFKLDNRIMNQEIVNDVKQLATKLLCEQGKKGVKLMSIPNGKLGIYWVRIV